MKSKPLTVHQSGATPLAREERRLANFIDFIAEGRKSRSLEDALSLTESKVDNLKGEISALRQTQEEVLQPPPRPWIEERVGNLQQLLEQRTSASANLLRELLGKIRLDPVTPDIGKPYFRAVGKGQLLAVLSHYPFIVARDRQTDPLCKRSVDNEPGDKGSNSWHWWR